MYKESPYFFTYVSVVLNSGQFCSPGDIWQCLKTILVVITVEDAKKVEARDANKEPIMHRTDSHNKNYPVENVNSTKVEIT